jgi:hypothetical protein
MLLGNDENQEQNKKELIMKTAFLQIKNSMICLAFMALLVRATKKMGIYE